MLRRRPLKFVDFISAKGLTRPLAGTFGGNLTYYLIPKAMTKA
jgi:hypothetical protein